MLVLMSKFAFKTVAILIGLGVILEVTLRLFFGFCNAPLYIEDPDYEYIYAPNQRVVRFDNVIETNAFSMRSKAIAPTDTTVVLLLGDSVINGGNLSGNNALASSQLELRLTKSLGRAVRVLNISAGSWGPDNAAAYLKKWGTFKADLLCLVASSHDAHDNITHQAVVGVSRNHPKKQYASAIYELWVRYVFPRANYYVSHDLLMNQNFAPKPAQIHKNGKIFNAGFEQLRALSEELAIPFVLYLHAETSEIAAKKYNSEGQEIINFAKTHPSVQLIEDLRLGVGPALYRDNDLVHFNDDGQRFLSNQLFPVFLTNLRRAQK